MIEIDIHNDIANANDLWATWGGEIQVVSLDMFKNILRENPDETDLKLNIHCNGGSVSEGFAIYDTLRASGKNISANIEGDCHSMAIVLLLAAPFENRTANKNCSSLIHNVRGGICGWVSADDCQELAEDIRADQNKILDIYADRTGKDKAELENIMKQEKTWNAEDLKEMGFISKINSYNTNSKTQNENNMTENLLNKLLTNVEGLVSKVDKYFTPKADKVNMAITDNEGNTLFTTDKEDDTFAVRDVATPNGTFTLDKATSQYPEGTVVVIEEGAISSITEPQAEPNTEEMDNLKKENEDLKAELNLLKSNKANAETLLKETQAQIIELKNQIQSDFTPEQRVVVGADTKENKKKTTADYKAEMKERENSNKKNK